MTGEGSGISYSNLDGNPHEKAEAGKSFVATVPPHRLKLPSERKLWQLELPRATLAARFGSYAVQLFVGFLQVIGLRPGTTASEAEPSHLRSRAVGIVGRLYQTHTYQRAVADGRGWSTEQECGWGRHGLASRCSWVGAASGDSWRRSGYVGIALQPVGPTSCKRCINAINALEFEFMTIFGGCRWRGRSIIE